MLSFIHTLRIEDDSIALEKPKNVEEEKNNSNGQSGRVDDVFLDDNQLNSAESTFLYWVSTVDDLDEAELIQLQPLYDMFYARLLERNGFVESALKLFHHTVDLAGIVWGSESLEYALVLLHCARCSSCPLTFLDSQVCLFLVYIYFFHFLIPGCICTSFSPAPSSSSPLPPLFFLFFGLFLCHSEFENAYYFPVFFFSIVDSVVTIFGLVFFLLCV